MSQIVTYQYGVPSWWPTPDELIEQLRLANDLWNRLVEVERDVDVRRDRAWRQIPEVAEALGHLDAADEAVRDLIQQIKDERVADRSTAPRDSTAAQLATARRRRRDARDHVRTVKDRHASQFKTLARPIAQWRRDQIGKSLYKEYTARGLGWGTYNDVVRKRYHTAVRRVREQRKQGRPSQLRFRRFDGSGTITVQIQATDGARRPTWSLAPGAPIEQWTGRDHRQSPPVLDRHRSLRLTIGRSNQGGNNFGPIDVHMPVVLHRDLPDGATVRDVADGADVRFVHLTRRRVAGQATWKVSLNVAVDEPAAPTTGSNVVVDPWWHSADVDVWWPHDADDRNHHVGVARIAADGALPPVPNELASVVGVVDDARTRASVVLPGDIRLVLEHCDSIRSIRDQHLDDIRERLVAALAADDDLAEAVGLPAASAKRTRSQGRVAAAVHRWPADHPLHATLESWRQRDRHLWEYEAHQRDQIIARRRDIYRKVAAWLCGTARTVTLSDLDIAELRKTPEADEDPYEARGGRRNIQSAAPGELRHSIAVAARRRGIPTTEG